MYQMIAAIVVSLFFIAIDIIAILMIFGKCVKVMRICGEIYYMPKEKNALKIYKQIMRIRGVLAIPISVFFHIMFELFMFDYWIIGYIFAGLLALSLVENLVVYFTKIKKLAAQLEELEKENALE